MGEAFDHAELEQLRTPPMSIEAEQAVLGGLMLTSLSANGGMFDVVADIIDEDDFYRQDHRLIYRAIKELANADKPYDPVTLGEWFESMGQLELVAGGAYLIELSSTTPSAANIRAYAGIVHDKAVLRKLIDVGTKLVNDGFQPERRATEDILAEAESAVLAIGNETKTDITSGVDGLRLAVAEMTRRRSMKPGELLGVTTSLDALDALTNGLQPTDLIILAARPSMGKTALMLQMMRAAAMDGHNPYGIELEMSQPQVYMRHIAAVARVDYNVVQNPARATEYEMARIRDAIAQLRGLNWWLDCSSGLNLDLVAARLRRMKKQRNIGIAFIDYLQYMDIGRQLRANNGSVTNAIQEVTRKLKALAKELNIPVVLLSQLNRQSESRRDHRPMLSDLRESGAIEQDADVVMFVHREGYYHRRGTEKEWAPDDPHHKLAEVIVAKARNGVIDTAFIGWEGQHQWFRDRIATDPVGDYTFHTSSPGGFSSPKLTGLVNPVRQDDED